MFKLSKRSHAPSTATPGDSVLSGAANSSLAPTDTQQELVKVAFRDTLKATGVPPQWLACEIRKLNERQPPGQLEVRLVVKKWSGHLLRYAYAFQTQFRQCLDRYEPHIDHSQYDWTWKFTEDCNCPFPTMPAPEEWAQKLQASQAQRTAPVATQTAASRAFVMQDIFANLKA